MASPEIGFDLLTVREIAELLHCSKAHISKVLAGRVRDCAPIPVVSLGRRKLVRRSSLLAWIAANEHAAADATMNPSPLRGARKRA